MWVNLSPYEKDRIVPDAFGQTEMGRDLLAQDYMLKQLTASLMYPGEELGKKFWDNVYKEAQERYGTTNIPTSLPVTKHESLRTAAKVKLIFLSGQKRSCASSVIRRERARCCIS